MAESQTKSAKIVSTTIQDTTQAMSNQRKQEIVDCINDYMTSTNTSQNKLAEQIDVSAATLSNMRANKWADIKDSMWQKVASYVNKYRATKWQILKTDAYVTIEKACMDAQKWSKMLLVIGHSGAGKTTTARIFKRQNTNVFYVQCLDGDTRIGFLDSIIKELGISKFKGNAGAKVRKIAETLNKLDKPLLLIDEAGVLKGKKVNAIKDIWNEAEGNLGVVLLGVNYVYSSLSKAAENEDEGMPEFLSRMSYTSEIKKIAFSQFSSLCQKNGIMDNKDVYKWLYDYTKGDLRRLNKTAEIILDKFGGDITVLELKETFK